MTNLTAKEAHIRNLEHQILVSRQAMNAALDRGDFRKAEQLLDQMVSFQKMLDACS